MWKKRNASSSTWNMARKLKSMENEKNTLYEVKYWQESLKNVKNEKYTQQDMDYGEKTDKCRK